jgi:hypothetical protein
MTRFRIMSDESGHDYLGIIYLTSEGAHLVTGARITYEQLKGGKTWFDAGSLAQEMPR